MTRSVAALSFFFLIATTMTSAEESRVELRVVAMNSGGPRQIVVSNVTNPAATNPAATLVSTVNDGRAVVRAEAGSAWVVRSGDEDWWAEETIRMPAANSTDRRDIRFWRLGTVAGKLTAINEARLPETVRLNVETPPFTSASPLIPRGTTFPCAVDHGRFTCRAPATGLDFTFRAADFAPVYLSDVKAGVEKPFDAGSITLRRGGSVVAWLDRKFTSVAGKPATADLRNMVPPEFTKQSLRLSVPVASGRFTSSGMVKLEGVPAGQYELAVTAPGFAVTRVEGVRVIEGKTSTLQKVLALELPIELFVDVDPASEAGKPWTLEVRRERTYSSGFDRDDTITRRTDANGRVQMSNQTPGVFDVIVRDSRNNVAARQMQEIKGWADATIAVVVKRYPARGRITMAGEPLASSVWFGGVNGTERVYVRTDDKGAFTAFLPRLGKWPVDVQSADGLLDFGTQVDVAADSDVNVEVPTGTIRGRVVAKNGSPVADADVKMEARTSSARVRTDLSGEFAFVTAPAGRLRVSARDPRTGASTDRVEFDLREGEERTGVELRILGRSTFEGIVTSGGQPLAGASVDGYAIGVSQPYASRAITDSNGTFQLALTEQATTARVIVAAGAHALRLFQINTKNQPVTLAVDRLGGNVNVRTDAVRWHLFQNGMEIPLLVVGQWLRGHGVPPGGDVLRIPDMAAGQYRACSEAPTPKCAEAMLAPGAEIELDIRAQ